jgi:hypothetical protein
MADRERRVAQRFRQASAVVRAVFLDYSTVRDLAGSNSKGSHMYQEMALATKVLGVLLVVAALFVFAEEPKAQTAPPEQPNIIRIMFDDSNANMLNTMDNAKLYIRDRG